MNKKIQFIICFLLVSLDLCAAVSLSNPAVKGLSVFAQLRKVEKHSFGKKLLSSVNLQIANSVPIKEIQATISEIKNGFLEEQYSADVLHSKRNLKCIEEEKTMNSLISEAKTVEEDASQNINDISQDIQILLDNISINTKQLQLLRERVNQLESTRSAESVVHQIYISDSNQTLEVIQDIAKRIWWEMKQLLFSFHILVNLFMFESQTLNLIIKKLSGISIDAPSEGVFKKLSLIQKSNPFISLISLASTLPQESIDIVNEKLYSLIQSVKASLEAARDTETESIKQYSSMSQQIQSSIDQQQTVKQRQEDENLLKQNLLAFHTERLNNALSSINSISEILKIKQENCQSDETSFNSEKAQRSDTIQLLDNVENILASQSDVIKNYFKQESDN